MQKLSRVAGSSSRGFGLDGGGATNGRPRQRCMIQECTWRYFVESSLTRWSDATCLVSSAKMTRPRPCLGF